jgi:hypothetical protein
MKFKVAIPTLGRPDFIVDHPLIDHAAICVTDSEYESYRKNLPNADIRVRPDSVIGISATRNWLLENVREPGDDFIMLMDDDVEHMIHLMTKHFQPIRDPDHILDVIHHVGQICVDMGVGVFGWAHDPKPERRFGTSVAGLRAWVRGCAQGIVDPHLRFDEQLSCGEDFDICVQSLYRTRMCWQDRRWTFVAKAWELPGGMRRVRTDSVAKRDVAYMQMKWGNTVVLSQHNEGGGTAKQNKRGQRLQIGVA